MVHRETSVVRAATLYGYVELAQSLGLDATALLARAGLLASMLRDPDRPIPVAAVRNLLDSSAVACGHDTFGLRLGLRRRLANLGVIGLVVREESTVLDALQTLCRHLRTVSPWLSIVIEESDTVVLIREDVMPSHAPFSIQSIELAIGVMFGILRELQGEAWHPQAAYFAHRSSTDRGFHRRALGCPVHFDAPFNGLACSRQDLVRPLPERDRDLARFVEAGLRLRADAAEEAAARNVMRLIAALLPQGRCTVGEVASRLGLHERTLHRRLTAESTSFMQLLHAVRRELVERQLRDSDRPITEVAHMLGFETSSALSHWFRAEYQTTPRAWRLERRR